MKSMTPALVAFVTLTFGSAIASSQVQIYVPDNMPAVGTCNAFPFGSATFTYVERVLASSLIAGNTVLDDLAFAPCNSGTFIAASIRMGVGHVPNPLPVPFTYPTFDAMGNVTALGSFIDYHSLWNSSGPQGTFMYPYTANAWSPLGFQATGGTGFTWNGTNDIGFFVTHSAATGTSTFHRTATEPFRAYASGVYLAAVSSGSGANGMKTELIMHPGSPPAMVTAVGSGCPGTNNLAPVLGAIGVPTVGNFGFGVNVTQGLANSSAYVFGSVGLNAPPIPVGSGCTLYLELSTFNYFVSIGLFPFGPTATGPLGDAMFALPVPADPSLAGLHFGFQALVIDPGSALGVTLTNALDCEIE